MVKYSQTELVNAIIREYKCSEKEASLIANYAKNLDDRLQSTLDQWIKTGKISDFSINGIDIPYVMEKVDCSFLESLVTLTRLVDPDEAEKFKKVRFMNRDAFPKKNIFSFLRNFFKKFFK